MIVNSTSAAYQWELPIQERLSNRIVAVMQEIVADNEMRMKNYQQDISLLNRGCFYGNDYYKALKATNDEPRLEDYLKKGSFYHGYASPQHFDMEVFDEPSIQNPTATRYNFQQLKSNFTPCEGLESIRKGVSIIGCGEVCQIACYETIRNELGDDKFNALFAADSETPFTIGWSFSHPLMRLFTLKVHPTEFNKGEIVYFPNSDEYKKKHINGESSGYFTICCDGNEREFTALGLSSKGLKAHQINQKLIDEFNEKPIGVAILTQEAAELCLKNHDLARLNQLKDKQINFQEFSKAGGGKVFSKYQFNVKRIETLTKLSIQEAVETFNSLDWFYDD